jgi:hypothetical protein
MKDGGAFTFLLALAKKLLKTELGSTAGKFNLLGGIIITVAILGLFSDSFITQIGNFLLAAFDKSTVPSIGGATIAICVFGLIIYFYLCTQTLAALEDHNQT